MNFNLYLTTLLLNDNSCSGSVCGKGQLCMYLDSNKLCSNVYCPYNIILTYTISPGNTIFTSIPTTIASTPNEQTIKSTISPKNLI